MIKDVIGISVVTLDTKTGTGRSISWAKLYINGSSQEEF